MVFAIGTGPLICACALVLPMWRAPGRRTMSYMQLFLALAKRKGYSCEVGEPHLVNGSATPPPSRGYPGLVCYMVTITVNKVEYHGYGPTAALARQFATFEAYKNLAPVLKKDVPRSMQDSGVECAQGDDSASVSTIDDVSSVCSEPVVSDCPSSLIQSSNEDTYEEEQHQQQTPALMDQEVLTNQALESESEKTHIPTERVSNLVNVVAPRDRQVSGGVAGTNDVPTHDKIRENSVGQLQEVFMKEFKVLPAFAESTQVSGPGANVEFVCTVEINDLSARG